MSRSGLGWSNLLADYMQGRATSLCILVAIGPLRDGSYRCFAELDEDVTYNPTLQDAGNPLGLRTFKAQTGADTTAVVSASDLSVDNAEMDTLPGEDGLTVQQIMAGDLDYADYMALVVDYNDLSKGHFVLSAGKIGEARLRGAASLINLEFRSLTNLLKQPINQPWSRDCRAPYGSQPIGTGGGVVEAKEYCGIDLSTRWNAGVVSDIHPTDGDKTFYSTSFAEATGTFNRGMVRALSGPNEGLEREIESHVLDAGEAAFELLAAFPYPFAVDDEIEVRDGCAKSPQSCRDVTRWGTLWTRHFRAEPYMPLGDAGTVLVGGPAVPGDLGGTGENPTGPEVPTPTPPGGNENPGSPTARTIGATNIDANDPAYGADPDETAANNVIAINAALAALPAGGGTVYFSVAGTYSVNTGNTSGLIEINTDNTRLDLDGVTLQAAYTSTASAPANHRDVIRIDGATEVEVINGRIIGYRDAWTSNGGESAFGVSEWAHGIFVTGSSSAVTIKDITITKCVGDCISVGYTSNDVWIDNCVLSYPRRQGVSNGGDNLKVTNCHIHHVSGASNGPCAGIDCEPDDPAEALNVTITGNLIEDCSGPGVLVWLDSYNITVENNEINRCSRACLINEGVTGTFKGNVCNNNRNPAKFQNGSTGWVIGGAAANDADNNTFFKTGSTVTTGNTTTLHGESSTTARHLDIDSASSASVLYNKYG